ncbi:MAG: alpha/beta hydrolase, partial [Anaerolineales bacterium]|nr:alpha/beta hydrolase [Anaerolineales bacterium]
MPSWRCRGTGLIRPFIILLFLLLLTACAGNPAQPDQQTPTGTFTETVTGTNRTEVIHLTTTDGVKLSGTVYHPDASNIQPNSILLLHEAYRDSQVWNQFARAAQERGYTVLALDLRGHGQSAGEIAYTPALD